jgi:DNA-binding CsgD family transcriptional regulator
LSRLDRPAERPAGHPAFEIVHSCERIAVAALELQATAAQRIRMLAMAPQTPSPPRVPCQIIATPETAAAAAAMGGRVLDRVPLRMQVVDGTALVMLTSRERVPVAETAVVVREPVVVGALVDYFDLLWAKATQVPEVSDVDDGPEMSPVQRAIIKLLLRGMTDATVSKVLGISTRSVRRHVAALEERAGVDSRFALGAAAMRLGWLDAGS